MDQMEWLAAASGLVSLGGAIISVWLKRRETLELERQLERSAEPADSPDRSVREQAIQRELAELIRKQSSRRELALLESEKELVRLESRWRAFTLLNMFVGVLLVSLTAANIALSIEQVIRQNLTTAAAFLFAALIVALPALKLIGAALATGFFGKLGADLYDRWFKRSKPRKPQEPVS